MRIAHRPGPSCATQAAAAGCATAATGLRCHAGAFGELALLYSAPRAATVRAKVWYLPQTTAPVLWSRHASDMRGFESVLCAPQVATTLWVLEAKHYRAVLKHALQAHVTAKACTRPSVRVFGPCVRCAHLPRWLAGGAREESDTLCAAVAGAAAQGAPPCRRRRRAPQRS